MSYKTCVIKERRGGVHVANYVFTCTKEDGTVKEVRAVGATTDREKALEMCLKGEFG